MRSSITTKSEKINELKKQIIQWLMCHCKIKFSTSFFFYHWCFCSTQKMTIKASSSGWRHSTQGATIAIHMKTYFNYYPSSKVAARDEDCTGSWKGNQEARHNWTQLEGASSGQRMVERHCWWPMLQDEQWAIAVVVSHCLKCYQLV